MSDKVEQDQKAFDEQTWSLDYEIAKFVLPRLERFRELNNAYPGIMDAESWDTALDRMIAAFRIASSENYWSMTPEEEEVVNEGTFLFGQYFSYLWW